MLIFGILLLGMLIAAIGAAVVGLWPIAVVDLMVLLIVAGGLRMAFPVRRAVLTYREIMERQGRTVLEEAAVPEQPVTMKQPVEQPVTVVQPVEHSEVLDPLPGALAAA